MNSCLVIVPCGQAKIWDKQPGVRGVHAQDAYIGAPFVVNRAFAESHGDEWLILSAEYGFILPGFELPGPYDVTFKRPATHPIDLATLAKQVRSLRLDRFDRVVGLGGKEYQRAIAAAFAGTKVSPEFPFAGLPIGKQMRAVKAATQIGRLTAG